MAGGKPSSAPPGRRPIGSTGPTCRSRGCGACSPAWAPRNGARKCAASQGSRCCSGAELTEGNAKGALRRAPLASSAVSCRLPHEPLEHPPHARLELPRVAQPRANRAVEVEQQVAVGRIPEVVGVEQVEDLDDRFQPPLAPRIE